MLISQEIYQDPDFFVRSFVKSGIGSKNNPNPAYRVLLKDKLIDFRHGVVTGTKFLVPDHLIEYDMFDKLIDESNRIIDRFETHNDRNQNNAYAEEFVVKNSKHFKQFCRLPFKTVCFETNQCLLLVTELPGGKFKVFATRYDGLIPHGCIFSIDENGTVHSKADNLIRVSLTNQHDAEFMDVLQKPVVDFIALTVCKILLYINSVNVNVINYKPTRLEEGNGLPKIFRNKIEYKILDIYREHDIFTSIAEISETMRQVQHKHADSRTHAVRGHFKQKKNGLFWWSPFIRCRKNAVVEGVIVKDYHVHETVSV